MNPKKYPQTIERPRAISGDGEDGRIYQIAENLVAKIYHDKTQHLIQKESNIAEDLYSNNISVPQPYGIHKINLNGIKKDGFVMQKLNEIPWTDRTREDRYIAFRMARRELSKAHELGYITYDAIDGNNYIFDEDRKIWLIDFVMWEKQMKQNSLIQVA